MKIIPVVFGLLIVDWLLLTIRILMPDRLIFGGIWFLIHLGSLLVLGITLIALVLKAEELEKKLRKWLLVTSGSAVGIFAGAVLHNLLDAAEILAEGLPVVYPILEMLSGGFFIAAVVICPVGMVIGAVMSGWEMVKGK